MRMPPSAAAMMPSAMKNVSVFASSPCSVHRDFHCCPPAITPGISVTVYSCRVGGAATGALTPAPGPQVGAGGHFHLRPAAIPPGISGPGYSCRGGGAATGALAPAPGPPVGDGGLLHLANTAASLASSAARTPCA